jgi:hypothetical protein
LKDVSEVVPISVFGWALFIVLRIYYVGVFGSHISSCILIIGFLYTAHFESLFIENERKHEEIFLKSTVIEYLFGIQSRTAEILENEGEAYRNQFQQV